MCVTAFAPASVIVVTRCVCAPPDNASLRDWFILVSIAVCRVLLCGAVVVLMRAVVACRQGEPRFSPVYEFESTRSLGITAANSFRDAATNLRAVWGSDVSLSHLQALIRGASGGVADGAAFVAGS